MNRWYTDIFIIVIVVALLAVVNYPETGYAIQVTMRLNTATNPDTLMPHHTVQVRGEAVGEITPAVTWDDGTGINLVNVGGDYWQATFEMTPGSTLKYKFWTGFDAANGTLFWTGWEGPINPADPVSSDDNRWFIAGNNDTTVVLQFYHGNDSRRDQYWRPYEEKPDSFAVYFRVNMAAQMETHEFDATADGPVQVQGGAPLDPDDGWNTPVILTQEAGSIDNGSFFSGVGYIANADLTPGAWQNFKFTFMKNGSEVWETTDNRYFQYLAAKDTTIHWSYFNNQKPSGGNIVTANLIWQINTNGLKKLGLFDRNLGDKLVIDGAKAWSVYNDGPESGIQMEYQPLLGLWVGQESFVKAPGATMEYKAVIAWDASRVDSLSPNYIPGLNLDPLYYWEAPATFGTGNRIYSFTTATDQMMPGDHGFEYQFFNGFPEAGVIETPIAVTFNIDMTPATAEETNPSNPLFRPGVDTVSVQLLDCLLPLTQGQGIYDSAPIILDDPDGNLVYTGTMNLTPPAPYDVAFRVNYTSESGTIQNGGGNSKGRSYYQYVHPTQITADGAITWPATYSLALLQWTDTDLTVEDAPNMWTPAAVNAGNTTTMRQFALDQNYPNPFNPETTIHYQLAEKSHVKIAVYNIVGQLVNTLVNGNQDQGSHSIQWNGKDVRGNNVPSGIYFTRMTAGSFEQVHKMTLLR
ncbi:T9SS type A sorting domain-containing protein [candidate division KSB1 bacterium]|nr:T9SS type A sorting domain-containing protein [candidate division KSB1 bacterium]